MGMLMAYVSWNDFDDRTTAEVFGRKRYIDGKATDLSRWRDGADWMSIHPGRSTRKALHDRHGKQNRRDA